MAQLLAPDVLREIFVQYIGNTQTILSNVNRFMLVCKDWYQVTCSGNFWSIINNKLVGEDQKLVKGSVERYIREYQKRNGLPRRGCFFDREKKYLKYLERIEIINNQVKDENIHKELTKKLNEKQRWYRIQTKIEQQLVKENISSNTWKLIVKYLETRPFGKSPKEICKLKMYDRTLLTYLFTLGGLNDSNYQFLIKNQSPLLSSFSVYSIREEREESLTIDKEKLMQQVQEEIEETKGKSIPNDVLLYAFDNFFYSEENLDQLIVLLRRYRARDFRPKLLTNQLHSILDRISKTSTDFAKKLNYLITKLKIYQLDTFNRQDVSQCIANLFDNTVGNINYMKTYYRSFKAEMEEMAKLGLGMYFDLLPELLVCAEEDTLETLKLVVESGVDLRKFPYLIHSTLMSSQCGNKFNVLKYLIEDCKLTYQKPKYYKEGSPLDNFVSIQPEEYVDNIEYLSINLNLKLTNVDAFVQRLYFKVRFSTLIQIFDTITEKYQVDIVSSVLSRVYINWQRIAVPEDANLETQKKVLRYLESKFPKAIL